MTSTSSDACPPPVASAPMGERIRRAWQDEVLLLPLDEAGHARRLPGQPKHSRLSGLGGAAQVELLGTGETFAAWRLRAADGTDLLVRIPWHEPAHPLADELAALTQVPPGVGPEPLALHDDPEDSPLGVPYLVTTPIPGQILAPEAWTRSHLLAHAERLAQLHRVTTPGRGPIALGEDPWKRMSPARPSLLDLFAADTQHVDPAVLDLAGGPAVLRAAERALRSADPAFGDLEGFVLSHGDLCATNIVWEEGRGETTPSSGAPTSRSGAPLPRSGPTLPRSTPPLPRFIDFEWAMGDDPARDLAIIGGPVHGGPWYVPLTDDDVDAFVNRYLHARGRLDDTPDLPRLEGQAPLLPAPMLDPAGLRARRAAWEVYEKTAMLLHVAGRVASGGAAGAGGGPGADARADGSHGEDSARASSADMRGATGALGARGRTDLYRAALGPLRSTLRALLGVD